jgi:hypothetical protein
MEQLWNWQLAILISRLLKFFQRQNLPSHLQECVYYLEFFFTYAKSMFSFVIDVEVLVLLESRYILCFYVTDFGLQ